MNHQQEQTKFLQQFVSDYTSETDLEKRYPVEKLQEALKSFLGWSVHTLLTEPRRVSLGDLRTDLNDLFDRMKNPEK